MDATIASSALSPAERERLVRLLAGLPDARRWALAHIHAPLLCVLGLAVPRDAGYARAARRHLADPAETRRRALALLDQLECERRGRRPGWTWAAVRQRMRPAR